jgi:hypothetical protein
MNISNSDPLSEQDAIVAPFVSPATLYWGQAGGAAHLAKTPATKNIESIE